MNFTGNICDLLHCMVFFFHFLVVILFFGYFQPIIFLILRLDLIFFGRFHISLPELIVFSHSCLLIFNFEQLLEDLVKGLNIVDSELQL
jgi:hypothetical protein